MKGKLTKKCYKCATIFVDHFSHLRFVHLQLDNKSDETLAIKLALEQYAEEHGVKILNYYCDNGRFPMATSSDKHAKMQGSDSPSVGSMPTFKMASLCKPSGTSQKVHGSNYSMRVPTGQRQSILHCGHMHCKILFSMQGEVSNTTTTMKSPIH